MKASDCYDGPPEPGLIRPGDTVWYDCRPLPTKDAGLHRHLVYSRVGMDTVEEVLDDRVRLASQDWQPLSRIRRVRNLEGATVYGDKWQECLDRADEVEARMLKEQARKMADAMRRRDRTVGIWLLALAGLVFLFGMAGLG